MQRKIIRVGTSAAVIIPKTKLEELNVDVGDQIWVDVSKNKKTSEEQEIDPNILVWTQKLRKRYKPLLTKLASS